MKRIDLRSPTQPPNLKIQIEIAPGKLQTKIKELMEVYSLDRAAACRILMVEGMEARNGRNRVA